MVNRMYELGNLWEQCLPQYICHESCLYIRRMCLRYRHSCLRSNSFFHYSGTLRTANNTTFAILYNTTNRMFLLYYVHLSILDYPCSCPWNSFAKRRRRQCEKHAVHL